MTPVDAAVTVMAATLAAATPLLLAALGELVTEKAGVLNLGVEGMMLAGAVAGFAVGLGTGYPLLGLPAAAAAGAGLALLFGVLTLTFQANQVAAGLALTIFGSGLSTLVGHGLVGIPLDGIQKLAVPGLADLPVLGPLLFHHDPVVYLGLGAAVAVGWFLTRSHAGLVLRAVGENPEAAHALGHPVLAVRYAAVAFGGAMAGLGGAYLSLVHTPMWVQGMTAGRGWIALALVVFAAWRPLRTVFGAWLFGGVTLLQLHAQGLGFGIPAQVLAMLPYLSTIAVLVLISRDATQIRLNAPAGLGKVFRTST